VGDHQRIPAVVCFLFHFWLFGYAQLSSLSRILPWSLEADEQYRVVSSFAGRGFVTMHEKSEACASPEACCVVYRETSFVFRLT
jgi:hypothetical protein